jgi:hypothetical protein
LLAPDEDRSAFRNAAAVVDMVDVGRLHHNFEGQSAGVRWIPKNRHDVDTLYWHKSSNMRTIGMRTNASSFGDIARLSAV